MAVYHAVVKGNHILFDVHTGLLEIYEDRVRAEENCPCGCKVVTVEVTSKRANL